MSEDGFCDGFEEPNMEIQIKTLMGTTFDIRVSCTETVEDIKRKIYRVEGIPIYQQNLIFQSQELKNIHRLGDAGIRNGSTLTLVPSMRGGPISTRRLSAACQHHDLLKDLKELLENTRDEIAPGSKVSVLVFKEGDIINLLRVIENEDGSYSPYSEKPISPPQKPARRDGRATIFERVVEDSEMSAKMASLRQKMEEVRIRKRFTGNKNKATADAEGKLLSEPLKSDREDKTHPPLSFKFLADGGNDFLDNVYLKVFEKNLEEESEEEIALKDKHRSKPSRTTKIKSKSIYNELKGVYSHTKQNYARIHKKTRDLNAGEGTSQNKIPLESPKKPTKELTSSLAEQFAVLEEDDEDLYGETLSVSARNRVHLTRLVLAETVERPKSSPNSIELEENVQDLWEIHEPASERLKHSTTCKVGLLKRRQSLDYGYDGIENSPKPEIGNYSCKNSEFEVCSSNFYHMPQLVSSPSAIPPQYAPKEQGVCDYYFSKPSRSPLYGRKSKDDAPKEEMNKNESYGYLSECSTIQRLKNDAVMERDALFSEHDSRGIDDLYGYYNLGCSSELLGEKVVVETSKKCELPPVVKKRARCGECNKRLNISNIYSCRCGRIFCSQHRYSETHRCSYDYKTEGRKILEQQNPLVTADKVNRI